MCVRVRACVRASVAQLVRKLHLENGNIRDIEVVHSRTSTDVISLGKKFTHNCRSRLRSIMSTWSLTGDGLDCWLGRTSRSIYGYVWT